HDALPIVKNRVFRPQELAQFVLELFVNALGATDETNGGHSVTPLVEGRVRCGNDFGMLRQSEVVVGAEIQHGFAVGYADGCSLRGGDDTLALISSRGPNLSKLRADILLKGSCHG